MRNKKGDLLNEVIYLVVAAIVLAGIIYGIYQIYLNVSNSERKNAENTLNLVIEKINNIEQGKSGKILIQGFKGATNWKLYGFNSYDLNRPDKCSFDSCICICTAKSDCQESGFCKFSKEEVIKIYNPNPLVSDVDFIQLPDGLMELSVLKYKSIGIDYSTLDIRNCGKLNEKECYADSSVNG